MDDSESDNGLSKLSLVFIYLGVYMWLQGALAARAGNSPLGYLLRFLSALVILSGELFITAAIWHHTLANAAALCLVVYIALFGFACLLRDRSLRSDS